MSVSRSRIQSHAEERLKPQIAEATLRQVFEAKAPQRVLAIDYFRGLAVVLMLVYDYVPFFTQNVPLFLQHGREDGLLFGDLVAPFFLFIMGVSLPFTMRKMFVSGSSQKEIARRVLRRAFLLVVIGLFIDETRMLVLGRGLELRWGVLETLGASYLISYAVLRYSMGLRLLIVSAMLATHLVLSMFPWYTDVLRSIEHGSPLSVVSWGVIAIFGAICGERLVDNKDGYALFLVKVGVPLVILGLLGSFIDPLNKQIVSSSYALFSAGASALFFMLSYYLIEDKKMDALIRFLRPLREFGIAALLAWALQYIVAVYFIYYFYTYGKLQPSYGIPLALAMILVVWLLVRGANSRGLRLKI